MRLAFLLSSSALVLRPNSVAELSWVLLDEWEEFEDGGVGLADTLDEALGALQRVTVLPTSGCFILSFFIYLLSHTPGVKTTVDSSIWLRQGVLSCLVPH